MLRRGAVVVRTFAVAGLLLGGGGVALAVTDGGLRLLLDTPEPVVAVSFGLVAALLAAHRHARRMAALLAVIALLAGTYTLASALVARGSAPDMAAWLSVWTWVPSLALVVAVLPHVVPEGRPLPGPWRGATLASYAVVVAGSALAALAPRDVPREPGRANPGGVEALDSLVAPAGAGLVATGAVLSVFGLTSLVVRFRRASGRERRQVAWFGYGVAGTVLATAVAPSEVRALAVLLVPAAVLVAATRYRLYDIDRLVNRTAVAAALLAGAAVLYAAVASWVAVVVGDSPLPSFAAAFAVAMAFQPARVRVQRVVDRLLLPHRLDPERLGLDLASAAREAAGPGQALRTVVRLLHERLRAARVTIVSQRTGVPVASAGSTGDQERVVVVPLEQHGAPVGHLELVARDADGESLVHNPAVHAAVTGPLTSALHAWAMAADLEHSRECLVAAREEERRRLRRDLHDGLGPQLAAITMTLDTARRVLEGERPQRAVALLGTAIKQSRGAVDDVRTVVAGLRPPALDELGLVGALRSAGPGVLADHDASTRITIDSPPELGPLAAATEVAAYRIAQEAVTNAVRHGDAGQVCVALERDGSDLRLVVTDDGTGFDPHTVRLGVGLASMRERAAELGGSFEVTSTPGHGSRVEAVLPDRRDAS